MEQHVAYNTDISISLKGVKARKLTFFIKYKDNSVEQNPWTWKVSHKDPLSNGSKLNFVMDSLVHCRY